MKPVEIRPTLVLSAVLAALTTQWALAQATGTGTESQTASTGTVATGGSTMATAPIPPASETRYLGRIGSRYSTLAGSASNLESLVHGLRTGSAVTLTSTGTASDGIATTSTATFTPPTRPMGYGNITRALTFASRDLAAAGITDPTPQQLQAALMGGTATTAHGSVKLQGVLQLRSQGMGWGEIAHTLGIAPGNATASAKSSTQTRAGMTTAAGASTASDARKTDAHRAGSMTTAAGSSTSATRGHGSERFASRGIVTAAGTSTYSAGGASVARTPSGAGIVTGSGLAAGAGLVNAGGHGNSDDHAHGGKR